VRRIAFGLLRRQNTLQVSIPFVRKSVPIFIVFRALGIQADEDIIRLILPNEDDAETKVLEPMLQESIAEAFPFLDTYSAVNYIKVLTKGFSEAHVIDILHNHLFVHVDDRPMARATFLAECVRKVLRVAAGIDPKTDRDDIRNQRCMTSGVLTRMLFQGVYSTWLKASARAMDEEFKYNTSSYTGDNFLNLFTFGSLTKILLPDFLTKGIMRGFKGKWGSGMGEEKTGVLQPLSRLSYLDFMSHCRRVVLDFDTGSALAGPRRLHTSQFGYFCTSETPGGGSIGITKNLSIMTAISTAMEPAALINWLFSRGEVFPCGQVTPESVAVMVPVSVNGGAIGYTLKPGQLRDVLKAMKWTGCLPASTSVGFSIRERRVFIYTDEGRPLRPLIHLAEGGAAAQEGAGCLQLGEFGLGQGFACLPVAGHAQQSGPVVAPVLHELAGQLHRVPLHPADARYIALAHLCEQMVQAVAAFVEQGDYIVMREQGGFFHAIDFGAQCEITD
jgi:DNA-directed RNA polymerase II subunit RPB2